MKLITEIKLNPGFTNDDLLQKICQHTNLSQNEIVRYELVKLGIDARKKPNVFYVANVAVEVFNNAVLKLKNYKDYFPDHSGLEYKKIIIKESPVVVGFGPSGMFCALALAKAGLKPIVLEQGKCVDERQKDVEDFWNNRNLNVYSNVQYGEGGAGTFSDGKLNTTLNNEYCKKVINELILHGAPKDIFYKNKAHIGTDNLKLVVQKIREEIIKNGGKVVFNAHFFDFSLNNNQIYSVFYKNLVTGCVEEISTNNLILALGHSSFKTFEILNKKGVNFRKKPFAIGVRIEHKQEVINKAQYGENYNKLLPPADYKLVEHLPSKRSVFTFCMCPGGSIVASSSDEGCVVTNGMSNYLRNGKYANSALLVNVNPEDFENDDLFAGFRLQKSIEHLAYDIAGKNHNAPAQFVGDFLAEKNNDDLYEKQVADGGFCNKNKAPICSYLPGITLCDISKCFPDFITKSLRQAIVKFDQKLKGFADKYSLLIAPETRSSCPVQAIRNNNYECSFNGLYMCGEGAGYAGGIISSAVDGIKCAEAIIYGLLNK